MPTALIKNRFLERATTPYATLAPLYDALLGDRFFGQLKRTFERLVQHYGIRFTSVADVACGTGGFVYYLRKRGVTIVFGMDRSQEMLKIAIQKNEGNGVRFLLQDFATLQLPQPVDLITCNFDSLNYLLTTDDLLRAFRRLHLNLNPGGHLIFDMITDRPRRPGARPRVEHAIWPGVTVVRATHRDPRRSIQTALVSILLNGRSHQELHVQRRYPVAVVTRLLAQTPFTLLGAHDFRTLGPATARTPRVVYVAHK